MRKPRKKKYRVSKLGPGSFGGPEFSSLTEALALARHMLNQGQSCQIILI